VAHMGSGLIRAILQLCREFVVSDYLSVVT
jgi:hypothetical protein